MKSIIRKTKRFVSRNKTNIIIAIISAVAFIIGGFGIGFLTSFIVVAIIDLLLFELPILLKKSKKKSVVKSSKKETKPIKIKKKSKKWLKILLIIIFSGFILVLIGMCIFFGIIIKNAPSFDPNQLYTKEASILYDNKGEIIDKLGAQNREKITYDELPEVLIDAIIATEDSRFFQHNGFDFPRFVKATLGQLKGNSAAGGASTITMQVVKNSYTDPTLDKGIKGIMRKFTDIYMAIFKLEKRYSKEEILEFYVNSYFMGAGSWGVEQASITYFGKSAKDLSLSEAALIAGLFQSPGTYNPFVNPEAATKRRTTVLKLMQRHGYISEEERKVADAMPIEDLLVKNKANQNNYQGFIDVVVAEVKKKTGNNPYTVPMKIYTTMDRTKQNHINRVMNNENIWRWENENVEAGISVLDTQTGAIVAIGTGRDTESDIRIDFATGIKKQIGSTAKPLYDYGPAIEYNNWSTYNLIGDEPYRYSNEKEIYNWDATYQGLLTARIALAGSRNIPALKVFQQIPNKSIKNFVTNLGLSPEIDGNSIHEAHAIGGYNGESPLTMSAAYAAFANGGYYNEPHSYTKIIYRDTNEEIENKPTKTRAMSEETAYMVNDMLITTSGSALLQYSNVNGYKFGAKTGTTNFTEEYKQQKGLPANAINDYWVVGLTDEFSISLWYGYETVTSKTCNVFGTALHASMFNTVAKGIFTRSTNVKKPDGVIEVTIERESNPAQLPSAYTPDDMRITELFKKGTEPTEVSTRFSQLKNPTNVNSSYVEGEVTLTWTKIKMPDAINPDKLATLAKMSFEDADYQQSYINSRVDYNNNVLGTLGYDIYTKDEDSNLTYVGTSVDDSFTHRIYSTVKPITYVVKTAYAKFKNNTSTGTEVVVTFNGSSPIVFAGLNGDKEGSKNVGEIYTDEGVTVYDNLLDVTNQSTISISVKNSNNTLIGDSVSSINFSTADTYVVTYTITYRNYSKSLTRTIIVQ